MADVLIINMWSTDVGRHSAANYDLLRDIFEVNLKLFDEMAAKKLLFIIRDFTDCGNAMVRIKTLLEKDIKKIWNECNKPV